MPLKYNAGQKGMVIPNVLSRIYRYTSWRGNIQIKTSNSSVAIDPQKRITDAWNYIEKNCARNRRCNQYFSSLHRRQNLSNILKEVTFTVHELVAKQGASEMDLPNANSAGQDFALSVFAFLEADLSKENSTEALAATILHEIAHYAGATTNPGAKNALEAENSLMHCGLKRFYNAKAKG